MRFARVPSFVEHLQMQFVNYKRDASLDELIPTQNLLTTTEANWQKD